MFLIDVPVFRMCAIGHRFGERSPESMGSVHSFRGVSPMSTQTRVSEDVVRDVPEGSSGERRDGVWIDREARRLEPHVSLLRLSAPGSTAAPSSAKKSRHE